MKRCPKCGQTKPPLQFNVDRSRPSGLCCWCRECQSRARRRAADAPRPQRRSYARLSWCPVEGCRRFDGPGVTIPAAKAHVRQVHGERAYETVPWDRWPLYPPRPGAGFLEALREAQP